MREERRAFIAMASRWGMSAQQAGDLWDANNPVAEHDRHLQNEAEDKRINEMLAKTSEIEGETT